MRYSRAALIAATLSAALILTPTTAFASTPSTTTASAPDTVLAPQDTVVDQILKETNEARRDAGLAPVKLNGSLSKVGAAWSQKQFTNGKMSHNPDYARQIPTGYRTAGENVAAGYTYEAVTDAWLASPSHRANILDASFTDMGIGYFEKDRKRYYTQLFAQYPAPVTVPGAPTSTRATADYTTVTVRWNAASAATRHTVTLKLSNGRKITKTISGTSFAFTGLPSGARFTGSVVGANTAGSGKAATFSGTTRAVSKPSAPGTPRTATVSKTVAKATWTAPKADNGSKVSTYRVTVAGAGTTKTFKTSKTGYTIKGLKPGAKYAVKVQAINSKGAGSASGVVRFATRR